MEYEFVLIFFVYSPRKKPRISNVKVSEQQQWEQEEEEIQLKRKLPKTPARDGYLPPVATTNSCSRVSNTKATSIPRTTLIMQWRNWILLW